MNRAILTLMFRNIWFRVLVGLTPAALFTQFVGEREVFGIAVGVSAILVVVGLTARILLRDARDQLAREADDRAREARVLQQIERYNADHPETPIQL